MSRPFQCLIVDGRKEFLKSDVLHLGTLMLWEYLVTYLLVLAIVYIHVYPYLKPHILFYSYGLAIWHGLPDMYQAY